jgi:hypothetical protein
MTLVTAQMSVSMDGFYAGPKHDTDPQRWMDGPEAEGNESTATRRWCRTTGA